MDEGFYSTQAVNIWISSDGTVTNHDPNTEVGFWLNMFHNECDRSADLERQIEQLRAICEQFAKSAKFYGTQYGSDVYQFVVNEKKFTKALKMYAEASRD